VEGENVPASSWSANEGKDPTKRHRHDVGAVDHGPRSTEGITRGIQGVLGLAILATALLVAYVVVLAISG
jgi:hypothetical protein